MPEQQIQCPVCKNYIKTQSEWMGMNLQCPDCQNNFVYTSDLQITSQFTQGLNNQAVFKQLKQQNNPDGKFDWDNIPTPPTLPTALSKYADFSGRSSRAEYWLFMIHIWNISFFATILVWLSALIHPLFSCVFLSLLGIFYLYITIPAIAVSVRRLHDINLSGLWLLLWLLPIFLGFISLVMTLIFAPLGMLLSWFTQIIFGIFHIAMVVLSCMPSVKTPNRWGKNPNGDYQDSYQPCIIGIFLWYVLPILVAVLMLIIGIFTMSALFF